MKVFISWSGERSQILGQALRDWLPLMLHYVEPWLSQSDIEAGERWALEISKELQASNFGIICVTRSNIASPWILFEAGALAKSMQQGRVIPLLLDIEFRDIAGPLAQFQAKKTEKSGVKELVASINRLSAQPIAKNHLSQLFEMVWPALQERMNLIPKDEPAAKHNRPQHEILEELVAGIRGLELKFRETSEESPPLGRRRQVMDPFIIREMIHMLAKGRGDAIIILIASSALRGDFPWIYELGVDAYRAFLDSSNLSKKREAIHRFSSALRLLRHGPFSEAIHNDKIVHVVLREIEKFLHSEDREEVEKAHLFDEKQEPN